MVIKTNCICYSSGKFTYGRNSASLLVLRSNSRDIHTKLPKIIDIIFSDYISVHSLMEINLFGYRNEFKVYLRKPRGHLSNKRQVCATNYLANRTCHGERKPTIIPYPGINDVAFVVNYIKVFTTAKRVTWLKSHPIFPWKIVRFSDDWFLEEFYDCLRYSMKLLKSPQYSGIICGKKARI